MAVGAKLPVFWLGINNLANEDENVSMVTDQVAPFLQWGPGQPNKKAYNARENCIALDYQLMHDYRCDSLMHFICEARP